ncbi:MAG: protein kinase [Butyrivibrio sp.]|nr:protein kinase [Butyrivibrio sp.]
MDNFTILSSQNELNGESTVLSSQYESNGEGTVLSSQYESNGEGTVLSSQYEPGGESTVLSSMQQEKQWNANYMLRRGDKVSEYTIVDAISYKSGEAQVYVGEKDGKQYAVKIYIKDVSLKKEVAELLVRRERDYLSYMVETGKTLIQTRTGEIEKSYEISPLYRNFDRPITSYRELKKLIAQVNEGLHTLHELNIYHKDIKPANILMDEDNNYRIIDFGISSVADEGQTHMITDTGRSNAYASPETRSTWVAGALQDYYSLGISIYELYTGKMPYDEISDEYERYYLRETVGINIPESLGMPRELVKLIHGLTYYSNNPDANKKRWSYEKVKQWLNNPDVMEDLDMRGEASASSGKAASGNSEASLTYEKTFGFNKKQIQDSYTLADELGSHWQDGIKQVGRGYLGDFFKENGSEYSEYTTACEDTRIILDNVVRDEVERNKAYWKLLYIIEPKLKKFYWHIPKITDESTGYTCEELGVHLFLAEMGNNKANGTIPASIQELADSGLIPIYLKEQLHDEERSKKAEKLLDDLRSKDKEIAAWQLGYLLAGKALFHYHGQDFETREQLYQHAIEWTNTLTVDEALAVAREFEDTKEFQAWCQSQEDIA